MSISVVILTVTDNTLFQSTNNKHFHPLAGRPMFSYTMDLAHHLTTELPVTIADSSTAEGYRDISGNKTHIIQLEANANYWYAISKVHSYTKCQSTRILVIHADTPLLRLESLRLLTKQHGKTSQGITFLIAGLNESSQKGPENSLHPPVFVPFLVSSELLNSTFIQAMQKMNTVDLNLANIVKIARMHNVVVNTQTAVHPSDLLNVQTRVDYALANEIMRSRINNELMLSGVTFVDPSTAYIDYDVRIGRDTVIYPNTSITGKTIIGEDSHIGPNTIIDRCKVGDRCRVFASVLESAVMENDTDIGPFSHLRKGAYICEHAHIGNYGELKNSTLGPGAKMGHFSYLGDTIVGAEANVGAGTITCNFDGKDKHPTKIGDDAFIGSGTLIVAPIVIGDKAITGAGSVVTHDVPENTLVYGVPARQKKKEDSIEEE